MVRKQILITPEQNRRLGARARSLGCPEAELIRTAIDRELGDEPADDDWKRRLLSAAGSLSATEADEVEANIRESRARRSKRAAALRRQMSGDD